MNFRIKDYSLVNSVIPSIEGDDVWSISINMYDGDCIVAGYADRAKFMNDYRRIMAEWNNVK